MDAPLLHHTATVSPLVSCYEDHGHREKGDELDWVALGGGSDQVGVSVHLAIKFIDPDRWID